MGGMATQACTAQACLGHLGAGVKKASEPCPYMRIHDGQAAEHTLTKGGVQAAFM